MYEISFLNWQIDLIELAEIQPNANRNCVRIAIKISKIQPRLINGPSGIGVLLFLNPGA